jgi:hypothetical protein
MALVILFFSGNPFFFQSADRALSLSPDSETSHGMMRLLVCYFCLIALSHYNQQLYICSPGNPISPAGLHSLF